VSLETPCLKKMKTLSCKTVGHSTYSIQQFIEVLKAHSINCIVDVRSTPYSRHNPQFNRETFKTDLELHETTYIFMGDCLGARYDNYDLQFIDGKVDFMLVRQRPEFQDAIQRVIEGINKGYRIALMCAEKNPFDCHRFVLVSYALSKQNVDIEHILSEVKKVSQKELEDHLISKYNLYNPQLSLFDQQGSHEELLNQAYELRNRDIAYQKDKYSVKVDTLY
jgi:uncharacterized protein (DUF488 family)